MINNKINNITDQFYSDEWYTERYVVEEMYSLLNPKEGSTILCPFDSENSEFVKYAKENNYNVIYGMRDFCSDNKYKCDYIITNPPFSIKDDVIEYCLKYKVRTCLVLPLDSLGGVRRHELFKKYNSYPHIYIPTRRIDYIGSDLKSKRGACFHSIYMILNKYKSSKIKLESEYS